MSVKWKENSLLVIASMLIGGTVGVLTAIFGRVLIALSDFRTEHFLMVIPFLAVVGIVFVWIFRRYGGSAQQGMGLVFRVGHGQEETLPKRLIPFVTVGTWLAHLFGASVGREGVAVQIGAVVANQFRGWFSEKKHRQMLITIGMASGFAGLFGTPIAATFFAMEVLVVGQLRLETLGFALLASFIATTMARFCGLEKFVVSIPTMTFDWQDGWKFVMLGMIFGVTGRVFSVGLSRMKQRANQWIANPVVRIGVIGVIVSLLVTLAFMGRYSGLGTNLIQWSMTGGTIYIYDWILKLALTLLSLAAGYQGGEVTPLFAIGASLGIGLGAAFGLPVIFCAALGYAAVFGSATNTVLAPIFIGGEVFGFDNLPYFVVVCAIAFIVNGNQSIYREQKLYQIG